jgi:hypothetical protein
MQATIGSPARGFWLPTWMPCGHRLIGATTMADTFGTADTGAITSAIMAVSIMASAIRAKATMAAIGMAALSLTTGR